jgi:hypothetical protein
MSTRINPVAILCVLLGALALLGCASTQTTDEYAAAHGYQRTQINDKEYFCRRKRPDGSAATQADLSTCRTRYQFLQIRYANSPPVPDFHEEGNDNLGIAPQ